MHLHHLPLLFLLLALSATNCWAEDTNFGEDSAAAAAETTTAAAAAGEETEISERQASRQVNCNCQCSSITFLDKFGKINGNCASADNSGAVWCYVDPRYNQCADLQRSTRTSSLWSYQACATPGPTSPQCGSFFGGNTGGFGGSTGGFGGSTGGFGGNTGGFGGSTGGFGGSTGGFGGNTGGFGGNTGGFGGNTGGFGGSSTGGFGGSTGGFGGNTGGFGGSTGGFGGSTGFNNGGIRSPAGSIGANPLLGTGNPGFSLGTGVASGPDGFPFQDNGGFQAVVSIAEKKATAAKAEQPAAPETASESNDSVSFSR